ncbi:MAG TPA: hypothetical protein VGT98_12105, partial [Candidatus Elarobacter sp.]|nr:hypothetical protein [Candidatus Elarobacter sp.]
KRKKAAPSGQRDTAGALGSQRKGFLSFVMRRAAASASSPPISSIRSVGGCFELLVCANSLTNSLRVAEESMLPES